MLERVGEEDQGADERQPDDAGADRPDRPARDAQSGDGERERAGQGDQKDGQGRRLERHGSGPSPAGAPPSGGLPPPETTPVKARAAYASLFGLDSCRVLRPGHNTPPTAPEERRRAPFAGLGASLTSPHQPFSSLSSSTSSTSRTRKMSTRMARPT